MAKSKQENLFVYFATFGFLKIFKYFLKGDRILFTAIRYP